MSYITAGMLIIPMIDPLCRASTSAQGICSLVNNISNFTLYPNVINELKKMDIEASARILENMLKELNVKNRTKTLDESILLLKECIINIENELNSIHEKLAHNYLVWNRSTFWCASYFRSYKFTDSIKQLNMLKIQLDNRTKIFFDILRTSDNLTMKNKNFDPDMSIIE